jgi:hypothetical protein
VPIGQWMLHAACRQVRGWRDAGLRVPRCAVNLSARQFVTDTLADEVLRALRVDGLEADALEVEITESVLMADPQRANHALQTLHALGVHIAIDDFGTGYSSLAYLSASRHGEDRPLLRGRPARRPRRRRHHAGGGRDGAQAWGWRWWPEAWRRRRTWSSCASAAATRCRAS